LVLSVNAVKAMPEGGKLTGSATNLAVAPYAETYAETIPPADYVALAVFDTGCGTSADRVSQIFEPFF
jgi:two-component system, cell cycle sensor histidine kinase and response regulator CckA